MCGPSGAEEAAQAQSADLTSVLQQNYGTLFQHQLDTLNSIGNALNPIVAAGPSQNGMSGAELATLNTQAINAAGGAAKSAEQAARTFGAGEGGGGTSGLTSGIEKQIESSVASGAANQLATQQGNIQLANEQQGQQNYWRALGGQQALAQAYNATPTAGAAIQAGGQSFGEAQTINQQQNQAMQDVAGFATAALGAASGGIGNLDMTGGSTAGEQVKNFFAGV